jgi:hypothetical protein
VESTATAPGELKAYTRSNGSAVQPPPLYEQSPAPSVLPPLSTSSTPATTTSSRPGSGSLGPPPVPSQFQLPPVSSLHHPGSGPAHHPPQQHLHSPYHHALEQHASHHTPYAPPPPPYAHAVGTPYSHHLHGSPHPPPSSSLGYGGGSGPVGSIPQKRGATHLGPPPSAAPPKKMGKWTPEEDAIAIELRRKGMKWDDISKQLPGRSPISCRLRYQNYSEKRPDWDEEKKDKLARLYNR